MKRQGDGCCERRMCSATWLELGNPKKSGEVSSYECLSHLQFSGQLQP